MLILEELYLLRHVSLLGLAGLGHEVGRFGSQRVAGVEDGSSWGPDLLVRGDYSWSKTLATLLGAVRL